MLDLGGFDLLDFSLLFYFIDFKKISFLIRGREGARGRGAEAEGERI